MSRFTLLSSTIVVFTLSGSLPATDHLRELQTEAIAAKHSVAAHWGWQAKNYLQWSSHSNRLIPVYTFGTKNAGRGVDLDGYVGKNSCYRQREELIALYGRVPTGTLSSEADYLDQTDVYRIQKAALEAGKRHIFLVVFDGMDWQTTRAASIHNLQRVAYAAGRGTGTHFQDYDANGTSQYGFMVTSPQSDGTEYDVDLQTVTKVGETGGGYDPRRGGPTPWEAGADPQYLISRPTAAENRHAYTDSASAATSMMAGIKTFNGAINVDPSGRRVSTIAHIAQADGYKVGAVSSVPISHATVAATYAHGVYRNDVQDLTRDLIGLASVSHPTTPVAGLDVLIGGGYGVVREQDSAQGQNFVPGNAYITAEDLEKVDAAQGGQYVVAIRTAGVEASERLDASAKAAAKNGKKLLGVYGAGAKGHLPFQTANGDYRPATGKTNKAEEYSPADIAENPTLAEMTWAALTVLQNKQKGFWLMVEAGDVDWANHDNNLDNSIGAVNSGDAAVKVITNWVEQHSNWDESIMIVTADHGHYLVLDQPELLIESQRDQ